MINIGKEWRFMDDKLTTPKPPIKKDEVLFTKGWNFANKSHFGQKYGTESYMFHLEDVVKVCLEIPCDDIQIIIGCILHDVIEDTKVTYKDVKENFGEEVAEIVYCVTDELGRNRKERKSKTYKKIKNNPKSIVVKLCDRISNIKQSQSKSNYNFRKMKMYLDENEGFVKGIYNVDSLELTQRAWNEYNKVILELHTQIT
jgi:(p)ppGpp synthase/HD superfamily hydrolase